MTTPGFRVNRFVWLIAAVAAVGFAVYLLRGAILPFIIGGALAYVLHPLVALAEKRMPGRERRPRLVRVLSILIVFAVAVGALVGVSLVIIPPLSEQFTQFAMSIPQLLELARATVEAWDERLAGVIPEEIAIQIQEALQNAGSILVSAAQGFLARTLDIVSQALTIVIGLAAVPIFLYYVLKDRDSLVEGLVGVFPPDARPHARNIITLLNRVFSSYVRGQLLLGLVVGVLVFLGLFLLGVKFSFILGAVAGLFELVPIIGPWIGAVPGVVVVLATSPEKLVWVVLLYLGVQLLENAFLVPRIQSQVLHVHPILIIFVLVVGSEVAGLWGVILGPPLVAAAKEVYMYFSAEWHSEEGVPLSEGERRIEETLGHDHEEDAGKVPEMPRIYPEAALREHDSDS